jgi:hypothetical protein
MRKSKIKINIIKENIGYSAYTEVDKNLIATQ